MNADFSAFLSSPLAILRSISIPLLGQMSLRLSSDEFTASDHGQRGEARRRGEGKDAFSGGVAITHVAQRKDASRRHHGQEGRGEEVQHDPLRVAVVVVVVSPVHDPRVCSRIVFLPALRGDFILLACLFFLSGRRKQSEDSLSQPTKKDEDTMDLSLSLSDACRLFLVNELNTRFSRLKRRTSAARWRPTANPPPSPSSPSSPPFALAGFCFPLGAHFEGKAEAGRRGPWND